MNEHAREALEALIGDVEKHLAVKTPVPLGSILYYLKCLATRVDPKNYLPIENVPKDHTHVRLLVSNPTYALADLNKWALHWTTGHCGFNDDENPNFIVVGWDWEQDEFVTCELTPDRVYGWLPFTVDPNMKEKDVR
ncbi:hypothetical protein PP940_gp187 [Rhizobium phage RL2RES]|uniref:Uncharacterized protein n=1 Tax=Rhizobium phage RL2RES TaxID=103371 RepID=A0A6B9J3J7_9CAUD|nr:hypothetical protein PP940_gp187 [Rhizobium phage RL2RES]QGZ14212.1 hypothetical protein RL2RES_187 [Rhizobium phage RL2RES]